MNTKLSAPTVLMRGVYEGWLMVTMPLLGGVCVTSVGGKRGYKNSQDANQPIELKSIFKVREILQQY